MIEYFRKDHILDILREERKECLADSDSQMRHLIQRIERLPPDLMEHLPPNFEEGEEL